MQPGIIKRKFHHMHPPFFLYLGIQQAHALQHTHLGVFSLGVLQSGFQDVHHQKQISPHASTCIQQAHALQRTHLLLSLLVFQAGLQDVHLAICSCQLSLQPFPCRLQLEAYLQHQNIRKKRLHLSASIL